jgi:(S)-ureidoglycine aminohydrolase
MIHLGLTRSSNQRDHLLQTPDTFVRAPLPGMRNANAIVHVAPALGAAFTSYTVEFGTCGVYATGPWQGFIYVLEGSVAIDGRALSANHYAYLPVGSMAVMKAADPARAVVFERTTMPEPKAAAFDGDERLVMGTPLQGDDALEVRTLFPDNPDYDFAVNTMTYQPGATLPMVEIHVMEHGLLMLEGGGIYRLDDRWYPVTAGDFIWMGPYCPQWFGALGKAPAKYLIYKDWNRHPLAAR